MESTKILMVDDERRLCDSISQLLRSNNYEVATAKSGKEAKERLAYETFDLAILDLHLPDMSGIDIMLDIMAQSPETVVIIITGEADIESALTSLKHGAYDYLRKPFEFEELLNTVEHALEQKQLKHEKDKIKERLQRAERMESIGTLAGGVAHDFNNILMGVQGRSTLISMDIDKPQAISEHLRAIDEYIQSATKLTRQLLGFARGGKYEVKSTDIIELISKSTEMFGRTKKEIIIETKFHNDRVFVEGDPGQIEQVFLNLYVNAWQAMPSGGILRLETNEHLISESECESYQLKPGKYVEISVMDTGIGINQSIIKRIFDPFFTTKEKSRGTGLGLASAYGIIKNHGGFINVSSEIGVGTTFFIYLPISKDETMKKFQKKTVVNKGSETILLVDDEDMILDVGTSLLKNLGYHVIPVNSGKEAIKIIELNRHSIDLVLLDMIMPEMDGGKTFDQIRKIRPDIPVVLSSGYALNGQAQQIMYNGCSGFIQKPFTLSELSQKVRHILDAAKNRQNQGHMV